MTIVRTPRSPEAQQLDFNVFGVGGHLHRVLLRGTGVLSLWNLTPDTALIVPENPNVETDLKIAAEFAWPTIARQLRLGKTVDEALAEAKDFCVADSTDTPPKPQRDPNHPFRVPCMYQATWKKVGGANVTRITPR